jgi:hypothetical protein
MNTSVRYSLMFALGVAIGILVGIFVAKPARNPTYVLRKDLDLEKTYFFSNAHPPVRGTIAAGSQCEVEWRYSRAAYVTFRTVLDKAVLENATTAPLQQSSSRRPK